MADGAVETKQSGVTDVVFTSPAPANGYAEPVTPRYWLARELVVIGVFAALIKISSLLIALAGGGMNPVSLVLKNVVATALLVVLLYKVPKFGVLSLFVLISAVISVLLTGSRLMTTPGILFAGVICDGILRLSNGYRKPAFLLPVIGLFDLFSRAISLAVSFLVFREEPKMLIVGAIIVGIGYIGCLIGLGCGIYFVKELKHAGIIRR